MENCIQSKEPDSTQNEPPTEPPDCWDLKQVKYFTKEYPWLHIHQNMLGCRTCKKYNLNLINKQGIHVSKEWCEGKVAAVGDNISKQQISLRKKIAKHKNSKIHLKIVQLKDNSKLEVMPNQILKMSNADVDNTKKIFMTAYFIAKNQKPFTDM